MKSRLTLILVLLPLLAAPVHAGIIFGKKALPKPDPAVRVPELIKIVHTDGDENKRSEAVDELRQYDATTFPEIIPTLIDALLNDKKPAVRAEAAATIAKIRPVSQAAGDALEQALDKDASMRVRLQIRKSLLEYHWAGYRQGKKEDAPAVTTKEPPLADPKPAPGPTPPRLAPTDPPSTMTPRPLPPMPVQILAPVPQPLPQGPALEPTEPAPKTSPTQPKPAESGPDLGGPSA
jgi:HEAT repeat protein